VLDWYAGAMKSAADTLVRHSGGQPQARLHRLLERYTASCLLLDLAGVALALLAAGALRFTLPFGRTLIPHEEYLRWFLFPLALACWGLAASQAQLYEWHWLLNLRSELFRLVLVVAGTTVLLAGSLYLTYRDLPRLLFIYFIGLTFLLNICSRLLLRMLMRRGLDGDVTERVLFVGDGRGAQSLARRLQTDARRWPPVMVLGAVGDPASTWPAQVPRLGEPAALEAVIDQWAITTVVIALPSSEHERVLALLDRLATLPVDVRVIPDVLDLAYARATITTIEGIPLVGLRDPALPPSGRLVKYTFDRALSLACLVLGLPLFGVLAALIKLDSPGPVLYPAARIGENGQVFRMYKFRTMRTGADQQPSALRPAEARDTAIYKTPDDPRVTRVGRLLRRTSLDELPNLLNVLRGEMSLVGPRPEQPFIVAQYQPWQHRRTHIRPGMTGWWQVNGRSDLPMHQYTDYDLYYIENYSILLDLRILGRTVGAVLTGRGAY
jgi:exopolysaccharide biosynthesis polyprenyl glycosylphosphotransferase